MRRLQLDRVWKRYVLGGSATLVSAVLGRKPRHELWAVQDVSLTIDDGESVGLIGHNGAGKTTLLKLLAGITRPTRGHVHTNGRVASLINLGAGFHPELTGRENIYLNGVILGLSRAEVRKRFQQIVEFADLDAYLDTPLKRYSSGMAARLGFAVAAHVDPDLLLVDEVLSVGDVGFQDRSIRKMLSFRDNGRAILFVSHNLSAVEMMCQRTVWLDHGSIRMAGPTAEVVRAYLDAVDQGLVEEAMPDDATDEVLAVSQVLLLDGTGLERSEFDFGEPLSVRLRCVAHAPRPHVTCRVIVRGDYGPLFAAASPATNWDAGVHEMECTFADLPLLPGLYRVDVQLSEWTLPRTVAAFRLVTELSEFGSDSVVGTTKSRGGFLAVAYDWRVQTAEGARPLPGLQLPGARMTPR
jgi:lipopolysaccharide transport system ATP-binding protein